MLLRREFLGAIGVAALGSIKERSVKVETVYKSPGPAPNGLQATDEGLWVLDQKDNHAYLIEYEPLEDTEDGLTRSLSYLRKAFPDASLDR